MGAARRTRRRSHERSSASPTADDPYPDEERNRIQTQALFAGVEAGWVLQDLLATVLDIAARAMTIEVDDRHGAPSARCSGPNRAQH
jgi:hypothetical protein